MKILKITSILLVAVIMAFYGAHDVMARGGGGHAGGGHMGGGGWHGGGEHHGGDHGDRGDHGQHRHDNNNNSHNTTNNVNVQGYGDGGWYGYGAADGALAGLAVGTALGAVAASANEPSTIVVEQPSTTTIVQQAAPVFPVGTQVTALPGACQGQNVNGSLLYNCGGTWYKPYFGPSGVYYQVVPAPSQSGAAS